MKRKPVLNDGGLQGDAAAVRRWLGAAWRAGGGRAGQQRGGTREAVVSRTLLALALALGAPLYGQYEPQRFPDYHLIDAQAVAAPFSPVALEGAACEAPTSMALRDEVRGQTVSIHGAPFRFREDGAMPAVGKEALGRIAVELSTSSRELYLIVQAAIPERMFTHQNWRSKMYLWRLAEPTFFGVELIYDDGSRDEFIPFNLELDDYGLLPGAQTLVVHPAEGKRARRLLFHDRMGNAAFAVAAVTANAGPPMVALPRRMSALPRERVMARASASEPHRAASASASFGTEGGLRWEGLEASIPAGPIALRRGPVFRLETENATYDSTCWEVVGERRGSQGFEVDLALTSGSLRLVGRFAARATGDGRVSLDLSVRNRSHEELNGRLQFPVVADLAIGHPRDTWYFFTANGGIVSDRAVRWEDDTDRGDAEIWVFSDKKPLQFDGFFNPVQGGGLTLTTLDRRLVPRRYELSKEPERGCCYRIEYTPWRLPPGAAWRAPTTVLAANREGWREQLRAYRHERPNWEAPRRRTGNAEFYGAALMATPAIWTTTFRKDVLADFERYYGVDWVHLFGWSFHPNDGPDIPPAPDSPRAKQPKARWMWKRWGVYDCFDKYGGLDGFRRDVIDHVQREFDASISYYLDPYLYDEDWDRELEDWFARQPAERRAAIAERYHRQFERSVDTMNQERLIELWAARDGTGRKKGSHHSTAMCVAQPGWRAYFADAVSSVARRLSPQAIYIDEANRRVGSKICSAPNHDHEPGAHLAAGLTLMRELRERVDPDIALFTEYAAVDVIAPWQNGSLGHIASMGWNKSPNQTRSRYEASAPHFVNLHRFVFPRFRQFEIYGFRNLEHGNWFLLRVPFFNGYGYYGRGFAAEQLGGDEEPEPAAQAFLRRALRVLREHREIFADDDVEPLVPTEQTLLFANRFGQGQSVIWTLFNANYQTRRGTVLRVAHVAGTEYLDAWNQRPVEATVDRDGVARLAYELGPRAVGCILRRPTGK